jgi:hypothetical protein
MNDHDPIAAAYLEYLKQLGHVLPLFPPAFRYPEYLDSLPVSKTYRLTYTEEAGIRIRFAGRMLMPEIVTCNIIDPSVSWAVTRRRLSMVRNRITFHATEVAQAREAQHAELSLSHQS